MKQKTHKSAAKRFKLSGAKKNPKVLMHKSCKGHLLTHKSKAGKKAAKRNTEVPSGMVNAVKRQLGLR